MGQRRQSGDLYRPVYKEGTHLAPSKDTEGAVRGSLLDNKTNQVTGQAEWVPRSWRDMDTAVAAAPLGHDRRALLIGRPGGPEFRPSEVARLGHMAGIVATVLG